MIAPKFWRSKTLISILLYPFSLIYYVGFLLRKFLTKPYKGKIKILCIGNITTGGGGKTPTALKIGEILKRQGVKFAYLSKGYGGSLKNFTKVDLVVHTANEVGDEPLLLAEIADTYTCKNRKIAVKTFSKKQCNYELIIMDDGFQNPTIFKDKNLVVINGESGFGNGFLLPAGPMRETFAGAIKSCKDYLIIGHDRQNIQESLINNGANVYKAEIIEKNKPKENSKYFAFSGLANNEKFINSLKNADYDIKKFINFGDHYKYTSCEISTIIEEAKKDNLEIITTKKDWVKIPKEYQSKIEFLEIELRFYDDEKFLKFLG